MDRIADIISVIHDVCLVLIAVAYLVCGWLVISQVITLIR